MRQPTQFIANGLQTAFETGFDVFAAADLEVYLDDALKTDGFTLAGVGGRVTVTFTGAPAAGVRVTLNPSTVVERETLFAESGPLSAADLNRELQNLYHLIDEQVARLARALLLPPSSAASAAPQLPSPAAAGQRALLMLATGALGLSVADPDSYEARVAAAEALVAALSASVATAVATANEALAATSSYGDALPTGVVTLVEGETDYEILPEPADPVASKTNVQVLLNGQLLPYADYELSNGGRSLSFNATVLAAGAAAGPGELVAGDTFQWLVIAGSKTTNDIGDAQITTPKLADNAIVLDGTKVAAGTAHKFLWRDGDGKIAELALPAVGAALGITAANTPGAIAIPSAAADADVTAASGNGYVKASQLGLLGGRILATLAIAGGPGGAVQQATAGWTISRTGLGLYRIDFPAPFASVHAYQVQPFLQISAGASRTVHVASKSTDHCTLEVYTSGGSNLIDPAALWATIVGVLA